MTEMNTTVQHTGAPTVQVFDTYCVLNTDAVQLLGLTIASPVIGLVKIKDQLYIGHADTTNSCRVLLRRIGTGRVCSQPIARLITDTLQGRGTYSINPEGCKPDNTDRVFYEIQHDKIKRPL